MDNRIENGVNKEINSMGYISNLNESDNTSTEIEIDVRGLMSAILNRLVIMILFGVLVGGIAFAYTKYFVDPIYEATTKVYIMYKQNQDQKTLTTSDLAFASYLAKDYEELLTTYPVLDGVKKELNLDESIVTLRSMIKVSIEEDTRIMDITVSNTDPKLARKIANKVREIANGRLKQIMDGIEPVRSVDEALLPTVPASPNVNKNTMLGFIAGFAISLLIVVIRFILDDTIKTTEDIEKKLGVSVLAAIPLKSANSASNRGYGYGETPTKEKNNDKKKLKKKDKKLKEKDKKNKGKE